MVECEFISASYSSALDPSFNRYMVECESIFFTFSYIPKSVLIDTWWNVNRVHRIDLRVAQQRMNLRTSANEVSGVKHIMKVKPKKTALGKVAAASTADVSGEYAVSYYAMYLDGSKVTEIDPLNFVCIINGKDYLKDVRKALGK